MSGIAEELGAGLGRLDTISRGLARLIEIECGRRCRVVGLHPMEDGHAGLTFGFDVVDDTPHTLASYVLKVAPMGVARRGNTDVYRQAPLLRGLKAAGMPVPAVPWASPNDDLLGTPFIVMERLPGRVFLVWEPHNSFPCEAASIRELWLAAAQTLARLHKVDWRTALPDWEAPRPLREELEYWTPLLRHAQEREWFEAGNELHELLATDVPEAGPVGVVHGDFQPGNILYVDGEFKGVIDWELASIGSQGLDVGWLLMISDSRGWDPAWRPVAPVSRDDLISDYREAGGPVLSDTDWFQALAHYRMGAIACLNVKLHRTGKRTDALWERFAPSITPLFARGIELARHVAGVRDARRIA